MNLQDYPFQIFYGPADDPLHSFYIPALKATQRYDRSAGFFSSTALAVAAEGIAHLIQNGGTMRLLVGAQLSEDDVEAIRQGYDQRALLGERMLAQITDLQNTLQQKRLEALAWMVAAGQLEIRVVLPCGPNHLPLPASQCADYYHTKMGIFTDAEENQIAFAGSVNESETAWVHNFETFTVYFSWNETASYLAQVSINFERLWTGQDPYWIAVTLPDAVRQQLLHYAPRQAPTHDPLEREEPVEINEPDAVAYSPSCTADQREKIIFQFLRDAPHLIQSGSLGAATAAVIAWPHQTRVADAVIQRFPDRAMLCDEVGLGKTIETGLVLRQLILSGFVKRCLILAPKSVLRQWQEELYEKFALRVPRYDGKNFWGLYGQPIDSQEGNPWNSYPVLLAGSQLAKRADRRQQILSANHWDLLIVDEAHHARRKDFKQHIYRPNRLLSLINELSQQNKITGLLLMTATPMQVHPLEVWDLLKLLGLGGRWGADDENFLQYFTELRKQYASVDWEFVFGMLRDELQTGGTLDADFVERAQAEIGPVKWSAIEGLIHQPGNPAITLKALGDSVQPYVSELARLHTPLHRYVFRNTRTLLREYKRQGILKKNVPTRRPKIIRVNMRPEETDLYERIDEYISYFYQKYEHERRGLGFIMTVYRRRLTSSFYAVRCSLERRLQYLRGALSPDTLLDAEELEPDELSQEELALDLMDEAETAPMPTGNEPLSREMYQAEVNYLQTFIHDLQALGRADSKLEHLKQNLRQIFSQRSTVLVFTQYTDTMDYLRDELREVYGAELACYSGRGGETWNGIAWVQTTKEFVKAEFKEGRIRILLCTESASEGLNLQTCGVLINYDMPWNPMRVEQRIGRIDRIGQQFSEVWIDNYFYADTIEDMIYQRLSERITWFEVVVGELQPILAEVGEVTRRLAMLPSEERQRQLESEIDALKQRLQNKEVESLNLDTYSESGTYRPPQPSPVTMANLEDVLTHSSATSALFQPHPTIPRAYLLDHNGSSLTVTFARECFDAHPQTVQFLTYGNPNLDELLALNPAPTFEKTDLFLRFESSSDVQFCGWYYPVEDGSAQPIDSLETLLHQLDAHPGSSFSGDGFTHLAEDQFNAAVTNILQNQRTVIKQRVYGNWLAEKSKAQRLLVKAALVELALGQQPELLDTETYPSAFTEQAVLGLRRHNYPWAPVIALLANVEGLVPTRDDPFFQQIEGSSKDSLRTMWSELTGECKKLVLILSAAHKNYVAFMDD